MTVTVLTRATKLGSTVEIGAPTGATVNQRLLGGLFSFADQDDPDAALTAAGAINVHRIDGILTYTPIKAGAPDGSHPTAGQSGDYSYDWRVLDWEIDSMVGDELYISLNYCPQLLGGSLAPFTGDGGDPGWYVGAAPEVPNDPVAFATMCVDVVHHVTVTRGVSVPRWGLGNEPDQTGLYWNGDPADYFALYAEVAPAIKALNSALKVGGPEISNMNLPTVAAWIEDLIAYCDTNTLPLDFISWHNYEGHGWDLARAVALIEQAKTSVGWADPLETVVGEWAPFTNQNWPNFGAPPWATDDERPLYDDQGAAMTAIQLMEAQALEISRLVYFKSKLEATDPPGTDSGLFGAAGAWAPGNVYRLWARMGDAEVLGGAIAADPGIHALRALGADGTLYVFLACHHYRRDENFAVTITGIENTGESTLTVVDRTHSNQFTGNAELETVPVADVSAGQIRLSLQARSAALLEVSA